MRTELTAYDKNGKKKLNKPEADVQVYFKPPDYSRTDLRDSYVIYKGFFRYARIGRKNKKKFQSKSHIFFELSSRNWISCMLF